MTHPSRTCIRSGLRSRLVPYTCLAPFSSGYLYDYLNLGTRRRFVQEYRSCGGSHLQRAAPVDPGLIRLGVTEPANPIPFRPIAVPNRGGGLPDWGGRPARRK